MTWHSKAPPRDRHGAAHFLGPEGEPLCASIMFRDGPAIRPFKCPWTTRDPFDHLCSYCSRLAKDGLVCACARCGVLDRTRGIHGSSE